jgi:hypothetical protein
MSSTWQRLRSFPFSKALFRRIVDLLENEFKLTAPTLLIYSTILHSILYKCGDTTMSNIITMA